MLNFLDISLAAFHGGLVLFNLTGWMCKKTRRSHLVVLGLTLLSWFGLGMFYGWGYCPFTDWHWQVKVRLGETDLPHSYIKYYLDYLTGRNWDSLQVDVVTLISGLTAFALSCWLNWRDWSSRPYLGGSA